MWGMDKQLLTPSHTMQHFHETWLYNKRNVSCNKNYFMKMFHATTTLCDQHVSCNTKYFFKLVSTIKNFVAWAFKIFHNCKINRNRKLCLSTSYEKQSYCTTMLCMSNYLNLIKTCLCNNCEIMQNLKSII